MNYLLKPEELIARQVTELLELLKTQGKVLAFTHVSNETWTSSWKQKHKNKAMGVRSGIPDYVIVTPEKVLFLELKREKGGVVSVSQKEWIAALSNNQRVEVAVAKGFEEAEKVVKGATRSNRRITGIDTQKEDSVALEAIKLLESKGYKIVKS